MKALPYITKAHGWEHANHGYQHTNRMEGTR